MPHNSPEDWFDQAQALHTPRLDIAYQLMEDFYTGDPNDWKQIQDPAYQMKLELPDIPRKVDSIVTSTEAQGHLPQLAGYYNRVLAARKQYKFRVQEVTQYFWIRLYLWDTQPQVTIGFPWYDTYPEMKRFLAALLETQDGPLFFDGDQGWECSMIGRGDRVYFSCGDPYDGEAGSMVYASADRAAVAGLVGPLRERMDEQLKYLAKHTKRSIWKR